MIQEYLGTFELLTVVYLDTFISSPLHPFCKRSLVQQDINFTHVNLIQSHLSYHFPNWLINVIKTLCEFSVFGQYGSPFLPEAVLFISHVEDTQHVKPLEQKSKGPKDFCKRYFSKSYKRTDIGSPFDTKQEHCLYTVVLLACAILLKA